MNANNPHFLGIGVPKAGTTWLYQVLNQHSKIWMPLVKELHFFDASENDFIVNLQSIANPSSNYERKWNKFITKRIINSDKTIDDFEYLWFVNYLFNKFDFSDRSIEKYKLLFRNPNGLLSGDITPRYCSLKPKTIKFIKSKFPDTKPIILLRDPIERDWSEFKMILKNKKKSKTHLIKLSSNTKKRLDYRNIIKRWTEQFNKINIVYYDDIKENPQNTLEKILNYFDLEFEDQIKFDVHPNKGKKVEMPRSIYENLKIKHEKTYENLNGWISPEILNKWTNKHY